MSVTQERFEQIKRWRQTYFGTESGRQCLRDHLEVTGLFCEPNEMAERLTKNPALLETMLLGFNLLYVMGIWTEENFGQLVNLMGQLPLPNIEE